MLEVKKPALDILGRERAQEGCRSSCTRLSVLLRESVT